MTFGAIFDYGLALAQCVLALLLWHKAEPRMREARGDLRAWCVIMLGFVMAWSAPLAYMRPEMSSSVDWQRSARDLFILLAALCIYVHAMRAKPSDTSDRPKHAESG